MLKVVGASWFQTRMSKMILVAVVLLGVIILILGEIEVNAEDGNYAATVTWVESTGFNIEFWGQGNDPQEIPKGVARAYYRPDLKFDGWAKLEIQTDSGSPIKLQVRTLSAPPLQRTPPHAPANMKSCALALSLACLVAAAAAYTTKYDNVDLDDILHNERLLKKYHECLLAEADTSCTADGKELKAAIPDALTNDCSKCNEKQKAGAEKVIRFLIKEKPELWTPLENKFDPTGSYRQKHADELKRVSA